MSAEGCVGQRVEGLHGIRAAEIDVLDGTDVDIRVLPHHVGTGTGADTLIGSEGVFAHMLVVVAAFDGKGESVGGGKVHVLAGEDACSKAGPGSHEGLGLGAEGEPEFEAELEVKGVGVGVGILGAAFDVGGGCASRRVAEDVKELYVAVGGGDGIGSGGTVAGDIPPHGLQLDVFSIAFYGEVDDALGVGVAANEREVVDGEGEVRTAEGVELHDDDVCIAVGVLVHAVVDFEGTAFDAHLVGGGVGVVVVVVVLVGVGAEAVVAALEDGCTEEVVAGTVGEGGGNGDVDGFVGDGLAGDGGFAEVVQLDAEAELAAGNGYGGTVGEFVLCIAGGISPDESIGGMDPLEYGVLLCGGIAEVEHLAGTVGRKEGGVA